MLKWTVLLLFLLLIPDSCCTDENSTLLDLPEWNETLSQLGIKHLIVFGITVNCRLFLAGSADAFQQVLDLESNETDSQCMASNAHVFIRRAPPKASPSQGLKRTFYLMVLINEWIGELEIQLPLDDVEDLKLWDLEKDLSYRRWKSNVEEVFYDFVGDALYFYRNKNMSRIHIVNDLYEDTRKWAEVVGLFLINFSYIFGLKADSVHGRLYMMEQSFDHRLMGLEFDPTTPLEARFMDLRGFEELGRIIDYSIFGSVLLLKTYRDDVVYYSLGLSTGSSFEMKLTMGNCSLCSFKGAFNILTSNDDLFENIKHNSLVDLQDTFKALKSASRGGSVSIVLISVLAAWLW